MRIKIISVKQLLSVAHTGYLIANIMEVKDTQEKHLRGNSSEHNRILIC